MQAKVVSVRFDRALGAFDARVDVVRDGRTFRYPCRLAAPADLAPDARDRALVAQALRMSDSRPDPRPVRVPLAQRLADAFAWAAHPGAHPIPVSATDPVRPQPRP